MGAVYADDTCADGSVVWYIQKTGEDQVHDTHPRLHLMLAGKGCLKLSDNMQRCHLQKEEADKCKLQQVRQNDRGNLTEEPHGEYPREECDTDSGYGHRVGGGGIHMWCTSPKCLMPAHHC